MLILATSSQLFLIPLFCAHANRLWLRWIMLLTYITSTAYHATESPTVLAMDRVSSRACTAMMLYRLAAHNRGTLGFLLSNNVGMCYLVSRVLNRYDSEWWVCAHVYFHLWSAITWLVVVSVE